MMDLSFRLVRACAFAERVASLFLSKHTNWTLGNSCAGYLGHSFRKSAWCARLNKLPCRSMSDASTINEVHAALTGSAYVLFFNQARPHQGIQQQLPEPRVPALQNQHDKVISVAILGGVHHDYRRAAEALKSVFSHG